MRCSLVAFVPLTDGHAVWFLRGWAQSLPLRKAFRFLEMTAVAPPPLFFSLCLRSPGFDVTAWPLVFVKLPLALLAQSSPAELFFLAALPFDLFCPPPARLRGFFVPGHSPLPTHNHLFPRPLDPSLRATDLSCFFEVRRAPRGRKVPP